MTAPIFFTLSLLFINIIKIFFYNKKTDVRVKNIGAVIKYHNKSVLTAFFKIFGFVIFLSKLP